MKKFIVLLLTALIYSTTSIAQEQRFVEVVIQEKMEVIPNEVTFSFQLREKTTYINEPLAVEKSDTEKPSVEAEDAIEVVEDTEEIEMETVETPPTYRRRNRPATKRKKVVISIAEQEKELKEYLKKKGIDFENLSSPLSDKNYYDNNYRKSYTLTVKTDELQEIMHSLDTLGTHRLRMIAFKNSTLEKQKNEMAVKALGKAKEKAEKLVKALDEKLGKVISISESVESSNASLDKLADMIYLELIRKNRIESFTNTIEYKVKVKFAIK